MVTRCFHLANNSILTALNWYILLALTDDRYCLKAALVNLINLFRLQGNSSWFIDLDFVLVDWMCSCFEMWSTLLLLNSLAAERMMMVWSDIINRYAQLGWMRLISEQWMFIRIWLQSYLLGCQLCSNWTLGFDWSFNCFVLIRIFNLPDNFRVPFIFSWRWKLTESSLNAISHCFWSLFLNILLYF